MKLIFEGDAKEIADLVLEIQSRTSSNSMAIKMIVKETFEKFANDFGFNDDELTKKLEALIK